MIRFVVCTLALVTVVDDAVIEAEHASEYVRVLEAGEPSQWDEAVWSLLGEDGYLDRHAVASVVRRLPYLDSELRLEVAKSLGAHGHTLPTQWDLAHNDPDIAVRAAALESLLKNRASGAMDAFRTLIENDHPAKLDALHSMVRFLEDWTEGLDDETEYVGPDPVFDPVNGAPSVVFDRRYLPAASLLLRSDDPRLRNKALSETSSLDSPGLREEWLVLTRDPDDAIRQEALWTLARKGDPRTCPVLFAELTEESDIRSAGRRCAPSQFLDDFERYHRGEATERTKLRIEGATSKELLDYPEIVAAMSDYTVHPDPFLRETAQTILDWHGDALDEQRSAEILPGVQPLVLMVFAFVSFVLGAMLFVWSFRLLTLLVRVRHRPISKIASMPMGPVALEGTVQPAGGLLQHPVTDEPCVYYAGADIDHPNARFYLVDDSGRALIDPRRAVLFSDDDVLVADERVHLVGHADREYGKVVVGKDNSTPPTYRRIGHRVLELLFGFGPKTNVSKMLFTDPARCFWIWDDLERKPMGDAGDILWLAASVLLAGAWIVVFAVSILGIVDQEMSASLSRAIEALTS